MSKNYIKSIQQELDNKNWDQIIKLATEAKNIELGEVFLGIRKGYVNLFTGYNGRVVAMFEMSGIKVFTYRTQPSLNKAIKSGEISLDMIANEPVIIFSGKTTVSSKLSALNWPICNFTCRSSSKNTKKKDKYGFNIYDHYCTLTNKMTSETINFKLDEQDITLKALMRDKRIDSILRCHLDEED
jgi:hypothetical protein